MKVHCKLSRFFQPLTALVILGAGFFTGQALAGPSDNTPSVTVSYADLNLANSAGIRRLHRRIETAARTVCGHYFNSQVLELREASRTCYKTAVKTAMEKAKIEENVAQK